MVQYSGCCPDVLFFTDGKPWKLAKPGTGHAATALVHAAGGHDVNLVHTSMVIMVLRVPKYSMFCKLMACATPSHVHYVTMI